MKICWRCKKMKPFSEFNRHIARPNGISSDCKPCAAKYQREYAKANRARINAIARKHKWGLSEEQIADKLEEQLGLCASCGDELLKPEVDHDHETGQIRDLLCGHCNKAIGHLRDSSRRAQLAMDYLQRWGK